MTPLHLDLPGQDAATALAPITRREQSVSAKRNNVLPHTMLAAREMTSMLEKGGMVEGLTTGEFSLCDMVMNIVEALPGDPDQIDIATWTCARYDLDRVAGLAARTGEKTGTPTKLRLMLNPLMSQNAERAVIVSRAAECFEVVLVEVHTKYVCIRQGDWRVVIITSANFNENQRLENYQIRDCPDAFALYSGIITRAQEAAAGNRWDVPIRDLTALQSTPNSI